MVTGIGTDIIEISRIGDAIRRSPRFLAKVYTSAEQEYCLAAVTSDERFAGRFAAKEAVAKALGVSLSWLDVEILAEEFGRPEVRLHSKAAELAGGRRILVSISHCREYAIASAVAELV